MTSPFRITPNLGPDLHQVVKADKVWYDTKDIASPQLGVTVHADDGGEYIWVEASGAITVASGNGTQISLTVTAPDNVTAATGNGGYYAPASDFYSGTIAEGDRFWARKGTRTTPLA